MKLFVIVFLVSISVSFAGNYSYEKVDTLIYLNGSIDLGSVIKITETTVEFKMQETEVNYEIPKKKIKELRLGNNRIIEFLATSEISQKDDAFNSWQRPQRVDDDDEGLGAWGVIGVVLTVLIVVGLLAQAGGGS